MILRESLICFPTNFIEVQMRRANSANRSVMVFFQVSPKIYLQCYTSYAAFFWGEHSLFVVGLAQVQIDQSQVLVNFRNRQINIPFIYKLKQLQKLFVNHFVFILDVFLIDENHNFAMTCLKQVVFGHF
eukprot:TRINITY_DN12343_c0_g3_i4.p3 TRINITY_DN12343_c0_g3~~TRINITY_DN12343_c0_g3_i4.p3  ORF type:complete len:129 (-),score=4.16 TRINITY_DN12343_c0_g3_i4:292-678(-)